MIFCNDFVLFYQKYVDLTLNLCFNLDRTGFNRKEVKMITKKFIAAEDDKYEDDFENLYRAAEDCDYLALKKYLTDIRFTDANFEFKKYYDTDEMRKKVLSSAIGYALTCSPTCEQDTQCVECLKLLVKKGADFDDCEDDTSKEPSVFEFVYEENGRFLSVVGEPINKKSMYNAVKFTLMHGGIFTFSEGDRALLEKAKIMSIDEFYTLARVGDMYDDAIRKGQKPDETTLENWIRKAKRQKIQEELEVVKERQLGIHQKLASGTRERNAKADELKSKMRERDASGSKKTLRAFLKEKSQRKVSRTKTPKTSARKQAVHE